MMSRRLPLPDWLKKKVPKRKYSAEMAKFLQQFKLNTVCQSALCPNIGECFSAGTATFLILGNLCTRNCRFCAVLHGNPLPVDFDEPKRIAQAARQLNLKYIVVTSPARDDLPDGGADQFAKTIKAIRAEIHQAMTEVLVPDFQGNLKSLEKVLSAKPDVLNHNLETVPRLYPVVRPEADYQRSLSLLAMAKKLNGHIYTKSGLMVGLGETEMEIIEVLKDLRGVNCDFLTIGQYLCPSPAHLKVKKYIPPDKFAQFKTIAENLGFLAV